MKRKIMETLCAWKDKKNRMPLILNGARQTGKTYIAKEFGSLYFEDVIYLNFELNESYASYFNENLEPENIIRNLEIRLKRKVNPKTSLLIFDEIQSCERALTSLKYFCEMAPEYHIIAAGSLLGVAIHRERYSFPVGKVETIQVYPMNFEEFLWAHEEKLLLDVINEAYQNMTTLPEDIHQYALQLYRTYLVVGGMPNCVQSYIEHKDIMLVRQIQSNILDDYLADMAKYTTHSESIKVKAAYASIPSQLAKENHKFMYKVIERNATSTKFAEAIDWLNASGITMQCTRVKAGVMPLTLYEDRNSFKLYGSDVGLLVKLSEYEPSLILSPLESNGVFMGSICENYVAQQLSSGGHKLYYWRSNGIAEVDYILQIGKEIIPVEVKAGTNTKSRSLSTYGEQHETTYAIRLSQKNFGYTKTLHSIPLYAAFLI